MEKNIQKNLLVAKKEKKILKGIVSLAQKGENEKDSYLIVSYEGTKVIIPQNEIDMEVKYKSLISFVGTEIIFVVLDINTRDDYCLGSRARAQALLRPAILEKIEAKETVSATVINLLDHGAYVEVDGLTGLLKNADFSDDTTNVKDVLHVGDVVQVRYKHKTSHETYLFEAINKYVSPSAIKKEQLEKGQVILGTVRNKQPWGLFVNVAPGVDALVDPENYDIEENQKVTIRLTYVKQTEERFKVRGKILSI